MTAADGEVVRPAGVLPPVGAWVPGWAPRAAAVVLAAALGATVTTHPLWLTAVVALAVVAAVLPRTSLGWALILLLAASELVGPSGDWTFHALLAGLHALHLLGAQALVWPVTGRVQLAVLAGPLRRFALVQIPAQALAVALRALLGPDGSAGPGLPLAGILGAAALVLVALLVVRGPARAVRRG